MSYVDPFGNSTVNPSNVSYRAFSLTADVTLEWPNSYIDSLNVVTDRMDVTPNLAGWAITMPDATQVSNGASTCIRNLGVVSFTIKDSAGSVLASISPSEVRVLFLTDNSTTAGTWATYIEGVGSGNLDAASVASASVKAVSNTLVQATPVTTISGNYTVVSGDRGYLYVNTGGAITLSLTAAATLGSDFWVIVRNGGSGNITVDPNGAETIDGASTMTIAPTESAWLICTGTAWYSAGYGRSATFAVTKLTKSVAGSADVTLTSSEAGNQLQEYTGILTGNINVIVPTSVATYYVTNSTTGAFTLTVKTAAGTGIVVAQTTRVILNCDGTNVVNAYTAASGSVTSVSTGTGLTGGPITGTGTISLANTAVAAGSYSLSSITVDAQGRLASATDGFYQAHCFNVWGE